MTGGRHAVQADGIGEWRKGWGPRPTRLPEKSLVADHFRWIACPNAACPNAGLTWVIPRDPPKATFCARCDNEFVEVTGP